MVSLFEIFLLFYILIYFSTANTFHISGQLQPAGKTLSATISASTSASRRLKKLARVLLPMVPWGRPQTTVHPLAKVNVITTVFVMNCKIALFCVINRLPVDTEPCQSFQDGRRSAEVVAKRPFRYQESNGLSR